jgi:hypothetical protein
MDGTYHCRRSMRLSQNQSIQSRGVFYTINRHSAKPINIKKTIDNERTARKKERGKEECAKRKKRKAEKAKS